MSTNVTKLPKVIWEQFTLQRVQISYRGKFYGQLGALQTDTPLRQVSPWHIHHVP